MAQHNKRAIPAETTVDVKIARFAHPLPHPCPPLPLAMTWRSAPGRWHVLCAPCPGRIVRALNLSTWKP